MALTSDQYTVHGPWKKQTQSKPYTGGWLVTRKTQSDPSSLGKGVTIWIDTKYTLVSKTAGETLANQRTRYFDKPYLKETENSELKTGTKVGV